MFVKKPTVQMMNFISQSSFRSGRSALAILALGIVLVFTGCTDPPEACFEVDSTVVDQNYPVLFTNCSVFQQEGYAWDFGDGTTSNSVSPVHKFGAQGQYLVGLTAKAKNSTNDDTFTEIIKVAQRRLTLIEISGLPAMNGASEWDAGGSPDVSILFQDAFTDVIDYTSSIRLDADVSTIIDLDETTSEFEILPKPYNIIVLDDDQGSADTMAVISNFNFDNYQPDETRTAAIQDLLEVITINVKYDLF